MKSFLSDLASASPAPGGGAAAALTAASGAALLEMTARINAKRAFKREGKISKESQRLILKVSRMRNAFVHDIPRDARVFSDLMRELKKDKKSHQTQLAFKKSAQVPFEICAAAIDCLELALSEKKRTDEWIASDLAESAILLEASIHAARLNVEINLKGMTDKAFVEKTRKKLDFFEKKAASLKKNVFGVLK